MIFPLLFRLLSPEDNVIDRVSQIVICMLGWLNLITVVLVELILPTTPALAWYHEYVANKCCTVWSQDVNNPSCYPNL